MKHLFPVFLALLWCVGASSQVPWEFAYPDVEMEDSISSLAIKPIQKPARLLKNVIERLGRDLEQEHKVREYRVEATFWQETLVPFSFSCTLSAKAGVGLENVEIETFNYEGPYELNAADTTNLKYFLLQFATLSPVHAHKAYWPGSLAKSPLLKYRETKASYDVSAYSIGDETGRGIYRLHFDKKKGQGRESSGREYPSGEITGTAYFDCRSLRLKEFKGEALLPSAYVTRLRYHIDYYEHGKTPVVKQIRIAGTKDNMIMQATVNPVGTN